MTRASTPTLLSLDRYAQIMGINPVHFSGATAGDYWPLQNRCSDLWLQHEWQFADAVSRESLALEIRNAEIDLARELGWWPAPVWISQEVQQYPRHYRRDTFRRYGRDVRDQRVSVKAEYAKIIAGGRRAADVVEADVVVAYSDADNDGFIETATVTCTTTLTDVFEVHVFTAGKSGRETWEIRPPRSKSISGTTFTATFWVWQMIEPEKWEWQPTANDLDGPTALDLSDQIVTDNLVTTVDVYRIYNDTSEVSALLVWEPSPRGGILSFDWSCSTTAECQACALTAEDGCMHVRDALRGIVVPTPASYSADTGTWTQVCSGECRDPDWVKLWYYCGDIDNRYLGGTAYDPLSDRWARAIAQLATARLERPLCSCGNLAALTQKWQRDTLVTTDGFQTNIADLDNPFGTRYGEILAWREVRRERHVIRGGGAI